MTTGTVDIATLPAATTRKRRSLKDTVLSLVIHILLILAVIFALLPVVFEVTARRVVTQPEPASADDELLWADARRADVLNHLASPVPHHRCQPRLGLRADRRLPDLRAGQHRTLRRDGHHH